MSGQDRRPCAGWEGVSPAAGMACPSLTQDGAGYGEGTGCDQGTEGRSRGQLAAAGASGPTAGVSSWPWRRHDSSNALTGPLNDLVRRVLKRPERSTRPCSRRLQPRWLLSLRPPPALSSTPDRAFFLKGRWQPTRSREKASSSSLASVPDTPSALDSKPTSSCSSFSTSRSD